MEKLHGSEFRAPLWAAVAALVAIFVVVLIMLAKPAPLTPEGEAVKATNALYNTVQALDKSFSQHENPGKITSDYIGYMNAITSACKELQSQQAALQNNAGNSVNATLLQRLDNSGALCKDLAPLAQNSSKIYVAAKPLLSVNTNLKRYQTLQPFAGWTRHNQYNSTNRAIGQLSAVASNTSFPTHSVTLLKQFRADMQNRHGLTYYPMLRNFQLQLLAERQQYWDDYIGLASLKHTLQTQQAAYCQDLKNAGSTPGYCKS